MSFSGWLAGGQMLTTLSTRLDNILVAVLLDMDTAGLYNVGMEIARLPYAEIISPLSRVLYPGFNRFTHEPRKLRANVFEAFQAIAVIGVAVGAGFAFIADDFVRLVLGEKWEQIIPMVQILSPFLSSEALVAVAVPLAMAVGETRSLFRRALVMALVRPPIFIAGLLLMGYLGGVLGAVVAGLLFLAISMHMIMVILQVSSLRLMQPLLRPAFAVSVTTLLLFVVDHMMNVAVNQSDLFLNLFGKVCVGTVTYCASILLLWFGAGKPDGIEARVLAFLTSRRL
jgi:PST family polysaccharide transporter